MSLNPRRSRGLSFRVLDAFAKNEYNTTHTVHKERMSSDSIFKTSWNDASEGDIAYSRPSVAALLAALFGLSTFLVHISHWFFFLGIIALVLCFVAFWNIRNSEGLLTGKVFAYIGLCAAVVALVSVSVFWPVYQHGVRQEADQFFRLWFAAVKTGDIPRAMEYRSLYPFRSRAATADEWWQTQYSDRFSHREVHRYVEDELIRVLMALGNETYRTRITFHRTADIISAVESDTVTSIYAITFYRAELGTDETFFVRISGRRSFPRGLPEFTTAGWQIDNEMPPTFYFPEEFSR